MLPDSQRQYRDGQIDGEIGSVQMMLQYTRAKSGKLLGL